MAYNSSSIKIEVPTRVGTCWHWGPYLKTSGSFILIRLSEKSIGVYVIPHFASPLPDNILLITVGLEAVFNDPVIASVPGAIANKTHQLLFETTPLLN
jgi:hypothetical protein